MAVTRSGFEKKLRELQDDVLIPAAGGQAIVTVRAGLQERDVEGSKQVIRMTWPSTRTLRRREKCLLLLAPSSHGGGLRFIAAV